MYRIIDPRKDSPQICTHKGVHRSLVRRVVPCARLSQLVAKQVFHTTQIVYYNAPRLGWFDPRRKIPPNMCRLGLVLHVCTRDSVAAAPTSVYDTGARDNTRIAYVYVIRARIMRGLDKSA